ncbi:hypothetical protein [Nannocystis pusilla]|uniref:hypothetical protein n=1 Tax=Nannocystis pusilla TaxID=889268 RepID=UPI003B790456
MSALLREGYACATHESHLVELLLVDDFADPAVAAIARERVYDRLHELGGTADLAWYLVRARLPEAEEAAHLATLARVLPHRNEASRCAMAAALRIVHARRGDLAAAEAARQLVDLRGPLPQYVSRAAIASAAAAGELEAIAPELDFFVRRDVLVALVRCGDVEAALARWPGRASPVTLSSLAWRPSIRAPPSGARGPKQAGPSSTSSTPRASSPASRCTRRASS